jgi:hypothetical protein
MDCEPGFVARVTGGGRHPGPGGVDYGDALRNACQYGSAYPSVYANCGTREYTGEHSHDSPNDWAYGDFNSEPVPKRDTDEDSNTEAKPDPCADPATDSSAIAHPWPNSDRHGCAFE